MRKVNSITRARQVIRDAKVTLEQGEEGKYIIKGEEIERNRLV